MSQKRRICLGICCLAVLLGLGCAAVRLTKTQHSGQMEEPPPAVQSASSAAAPEHETVPEEGSVSSSVPPEEPYISPIDFTALQQENPDIYAWIEIPGTQIAYPVLQHETDTDYYLDHTADRTEGLPGSIYTQSGMAKDFSRFNTVIYGHNMRNGSMFGGLKAYRDADYLDAHRELLIYTPEGLLTYRIFAAVVYDDRLITSSFDDNSTSDRLSFLSSVRSTKDPDSHVLEDVTVDEQSHLVTLSTCIGGRPDNRYLVIGVMVEEAQS